MWSNGHNAEAIAHHAKAVAICERLGLADLVAVQAYHGRGEAHFFNLEHVAAIRCYERSIELARGIGDKSYESENLMMIGHAYLGHLGIGDHAQARIYLEAALEIAQRADLQWHIPPTLLGLACARGYLGDYSGAVHDVRKMLRSIEPLKLLRYQIMAYEMLASLLLDVGLNRHALEASQRGRALADSIRTTFWRGRGDGTHAIARIRLGDLDVEPALTSALRWARENDERSQMIRLLEGLTELTLRRGDVDACGAFADEMLALANAAGMKELAARGHFWRGEALAAQGKRDAAVEHLALAAAGAEQLGRVRLAKDASVALAGATGEASQRTRASTLAMRMDQAARECERAMVTPTAE
jgi:tetratricopeptide (TPR) repeat protein